MDRVARTYVRSRQPWLEPAGAVALLMAVAAPLAQGDLLINDAQGISGFELYQKGATWWRNAGNCGDVFINATANTKFNINWGAPNVFSTIARDCVILPDIYNNAVRDANYIYLFSEGQLWKKAVNANPEHSLTPVFAGASPTLPAGQEGSYLLISMDWLFWGEFTEATGTLEIRKARVDGTGGQSVIIIPDAGAPVQRLKRYTYETPGATVEAFAVLLQNGKLYWLRLTPTVAFTRLVAAGIVDVAVEVDERRTSGIPYIYAAEGTWQVSASSPPGRLLRFNGNTFEPEILYIADAPHQVIAVEVDPPPRLGSAENVYISVGIVDGSPVPLIADMVILRNALPGTEGSFLPIVQPDGGHNLRSDGRRLHYLRRGSGAGFERIMDIATDAPPLMLDIEAIGLEITQFLQNLDNEQPLIANKEGTYARGYATLRSNTTPASVYFPSARLRVWLDGIEIAGSPFASINNARVTATNDLDVLRISTEDSFLFELPKLSPGHLTAAFTVNPNHTELETGSSPYANNGIATVKSIEVRSGVTPCLVMVPVPTPFGSYDIYSDNFANIIRRAETMLPIEGFEIRSWAPLLDGHNPLAGNKYFIFPFGGVNSDDEQDNAALDAVDCLREGSSFPGGCDLANWVGMVHPNVANFGGLARRPGYASISSMSGKDFDWFDQPRGGRTLAHELGHNYGQLHTLCSCGATMPKDPNLFFPGDPCSQANLGWDPILERPIRTDEAGDLMSYACARWPSAYTWNEVWKVTQLLDFLGPSGRFSQEFSAADLRSPDDPVLFVAGGVKTNSMTASLGTFLLMGAAEFGVRNVERSFAESEREEGNPNRFTVRLLDLAGTLLQETPLPLEATSDGAAGEFSFTHYVPFPDGARRVQLTHGSQVYAERVITANAPTVTLDPLIVDQANHLVQASWSASDLDGGPLVFWLYVSPDDGATWQVLGLNFRHTKATFDTRRWHSGTQMRLRVVASDGARAGVAISPAFFLPNQPPDVSLAGIEMGELIPFGDRRVVSVMPVDVEDGRAGVSVTWQLARLNGATLPGTGNRVRLEGLEAGRYELAITATDRRGAQKILTRSFEILPPTVPDRPQPELDGACADPGYAGAAFVRLPTSSGAPIPVRLLRASNSLFVAFGELPRGRGAASPPAGIRVDIDGDGSVFPSNNDRGFFVRESGEPFQEKGARQTMDVTLLPETDAEAIAAHGEEAWCAEIRIGESLLGGWDHAVRMMIDAGGNVWPTNANPHSPATWGLVWLGAILPAESNRPPVADAGQDVIANLSTHSSVVLHGDNSHDPDGDTLTYSWVQTMGPAVSLTNAATANPSFLPGTLEDQELRFMLTVADGLVSSAPDEVVVKVFALPEAIVASDRNPGFDGDVLFGALQGIPGGRYLIQASTDLTHWLNIQTNSTDVFGTLDFVDPEAGLYPVRFYRGAQESARDTR